jgi:RHS repeat-associated protein
MNNAHRCCLIILYVGCSGPSISKKLGTRSEALTPLTHEIGRLTTSGNSDSRTTYSYDALGREKAIEYAMEGTAYVYTYQFGYPKRALGPTATELGNVLQSTTLPDGEIVSNGYDSSGEQQTITAGTDVIVSQILRNALGQTISVKYGNGVESEHRYHQGNLRLRQIVSTLRPSNVVLQAYGYDFDNVGNVKQVLNYCDPDADQCLCDPSSSSCLAKRMSRAFDYDEMDRLITMKAPAGMTITGLPQSYAYDSIDNLVQKEGINQAYTNGKPHALASAGGVTYSYDPNGNLTSTSAGLTINWNGENMPTVTTKSGQKIRKQFIGEAMWKKVDGATTTLYLPSIRIENGGLRKYYGAFAERDPDAAGALRFYHDDHLGSSALVTDASGNVMYRAAYWPYGGPDPNFSRNNNFTPKYQFNSKEPEALSGLIDYGSRMYNPATGRWISPDSWGADGLNRYAYVQNNPLGYVDPTGHQGQKPGVDVNTCDKCGDCVTFKDPEWYTRGWHKLWGWLKGTGQSTGRAAQDAKTAFVAVPTNSLINTLGSMGIRRDAFKGPEYWQSHPLPQMAWPHNTAGYIGGGAGWAAFNGLPLLLGAGPRGGVGVSAASVDPALAVVQRTEGIYLNRYYGTCYGAAVKNAISLTEAGYEVEIIDLFHQPSGRGHFVVGVVGQNRYFSWGAEYNNLETIIDRSFLPKQLPVAVDRMPLDQFFWRVGQGEFGTPQEPPFRGFRSFFGLFPKSTR